MADVAGVSTLGVKLGYGLGTTTPSAFTVLKRVNSIGGVSLDTEQIDASALEDEVSRYVAGRQDTGGSWEVTFNATDEVITALETMISAYEGRTTGQKMYFEVWSPNLAKSFCVVAQPPKYIPIPDMSQNELQTVALTFTIEEYVGMITGVEPA